MSKDDLLRAIVQPPNAVIELTNHDGCKTCGATSNDRKYFSCPDCHHQFCGQCAVPDTNLARTAKCPECKKRFPWY